MLNTFPNLLVLGFFAPTIIRLVAACLFLYAAYLVHKHRDKISLVQFPIIGTASWAAGFTAIMYLAIGTMLFFGYYTQIAALLGAITSVKGLIYGSKFGAIFSHSRSTYLLLMAVCLSLLISGAGAFAIDLPL